MRRHSGELSRRRALALAGGFGMAPFSAVADTSSSTIMTRPIPSTGERLPVVGLGTAYQWLVDSPEQHAALSEVVRTLTAGGGGLIDTASNYGGYGVAETMLGEIFTETGLRPRVFIATKIERELWTTQMVVRSALQRLQVSKIDLMQLHSVNSTWQDLTRLREWKEQGLVRYVGATTSENHFFDAMESVTRRGRPDFVQVSCSLRNREAERRVLPAAAELGVAVLINMPFGGVEGGDAGLHGNLFRAVQGKQPPEWAREFDAATWGQFFLKYLLGNPAVTAVIPGSNKAAHVADNLAAGRGRLPTAAQRQQMVRFMEELA